MSVRPWRDRHGLAYLSGESWEAHRARVIAQAEAWDAEVRALGVDPLAALAVLREYGSTTVGVGFGVSCGIDAGLYVEAMAEIARRAPDLRAKAAARRAAPIAAPRFDHETVSDAETDPEVHIQDGWAGPLIRRHAAMWRLYEREDRQRRKIRGADAPGEK